MDITDDTLIFLFYTIILYCVGIMSGIGIVLLIEKYHGKVIDNTPEPVSKQTIIKQGDVIVAPTLCNEDTHQTSLLGSLLHREVKQVKKSEEDDLIIS